MLKPFAFRFVILFCLTLTAAEGAPAQNSAQVVLINGVVSKNVKNGTDPAPHLVGVENAIVVLCATPAGNTDCSTLASTTSDHEGAFQIVLDGVTSDSTYTLRARAEGEVWSDQTLGDGQDVAKWPKSAQITLGNTPSLRGAVDNAVNLAR